MPLVKAKVRSKNWEQEAKVSVGNTTVRRRREMNPKKKHNRLG